VPVTQQSQASHGHAEQQLAQHLAGAGAAGSRVPEFPSHSVSAAVAASNPLNAVFTIMVVSLSSWEWTDRSRDGGPPADRGAAGSEKAD